MEVVILCGGKGTRMWPLTSEMPKPLIKICDKAILWHLLKKYSASGFNDFVVCLGHQADKIREYFNEPDNKEERWNINFVDTGLDTKKSERINKIKDYIKGENFLLSYGDDISAVNVKELVQFHLHHSKMVTLTSIPLYSQFGILDISDSHEVNRFREKPRLEEYWTNGGFYVCNKKIFDLLQEGELEDVVFKKLAEEKQIVAFKFDGFWKCMNTSKDALEFNELFNSGEIPWKNW